MVGLMRLSHPLVSFSYLHFLARSRGDDLSVLSSKSELVLMESEQYRKASVDLNRAKWLQKYGVLIAIVLLIAGLFWVRIRYFGSE